MGTQNKVPPKERGRKNVLLLTKKQKRTQSFRICRWLDVAEAE